MMDIRENLCLLQKDDLIAVRVKDPYEMGLPLLGLTQFIDEETLEKRLIDVNDSYREDFKIKAFNDKKKFDEIVSKSGANSIEISTEDSFENEILQFFQKRKRILAKL